MHHTATSIAFACLASSLVETTKAIELTASSGGLYTFHVETQVNLCTDMSCSTYLPGTPVPMPDIELPSD